jgi:alginate O-acetyltransferase complex protein AlgI
VLFNSIEFILLFLPAVLLGYWFCVTFLKENSAKYWLIASSLFFYAWWEVSYLLIIVLSMVINYRVGVLIFHFEKFKRVLLFISILANLGVLGYYKYSNFFIDQINIGLGYGLEFEKVLLPLAISFFTFQQIAYLVDASRGEVKSYGFIDYCLFVAFFPQLIAGPIVHHSQVMSQFKNSMVKGLDPQKISLGVLVFIMGLFKKVVFADGISEFSSPVFLKLGEGQLLSSFDAWSGALGYTLQLYFDFSGYSDMAIGVAMIFGIILPINFNSPYKALSIIDFWRRWHITLSNFLRDYVYFPLGGNKKGNSRRYFNLLLTMLIGGLWHGAGWGFIFWGLLHGLFLILNHYWNFIKMKFTIFPDGLPFGVSRIITILCIIFSWVFFKVENFNDALSMLASMLIIERVFYFEMISNAEFSLGLVFLFSIVLWMPNTATIVNYLDQSWLRKKPFFIGMLAALTLFYIIINLKSDAEFLYFNF